MRGCCGTGAVEGGVGRPLVLWGDSGGAAAPRTGHAVVSPAAELAPGVWLRDLYTSDSQNLGRPLRSLGPSALHFPPAVSTPVARASQASRERGRGGAVWNAEGKHPRKTVLDRPLGLRDSRSS